MTAAKLIAGVPMLISAALRTSTPILLRKQSLMPVFSYRKPRPLLAGPVPARCRLSPMSRYGFRPTSAVGDTFSVQIGARPPTSFAALQLVGGPVVLVQLERDDLNRVVPGDRVQAYGRPILTTRDRLDEAVEIRCRLAVHGHDAPARVESISRCGRPVVEVPNEHAAWGDPALRSHRSMRGLQCCARPDGHPIEIFAI